MLFRSLPLLFNQLREVDPSNYSNLYDLLAIGIMRENLDASVTDSVKVAAIILRSVYGDKKYDEMDLRERMLAQINIACDLIERGKAIEATGLY